MENFINTAQRIQNFVTRLSHDINTLYIINIKMDPRAGIHKFSKNPEAASFSHRKTDMKQAPY